ncbi:hypothetical protein C0Q70_20329 [Pomacea canaliculata]|uniref:Uncharacterized protein n=1 Tax=Pomacea canaliculata TaxID=400727 RepID=A0A2T7NF96_POMCA|nr:hypothetical protein C0Q70_20329 [Pomacea canaliculata]
MPAGDEATHGFQPVTCALAHQSHPNSGPGASHVTRAPNNTDLVLLVRHSPCSHSSKKIEFVDEKSGYVEINVILPALLGEMSGRLLYADPPQTFTRQGGQVGNKSFTHTDFRS